jgi:oligopeptidase B
MECSENATTKENWKEVIAHRDDVFLEGTKFSATFLSLTKEKMDSLNCELLNGPTRANITWNFS